MDTSKENELMHNLERSVDGGNAGHLADGQPTKPGECNMTVNPNPANERENAVNRNPQNQQQNQQKQNKQQYGMTGQAIAGADTVLLAGRKSGGDININSDINSDSDINKVTPEMVNRIEMYGAEAVYNAGDEQ